MKKLFIHIIFLLAICCTAFGSENEQATFENANKLLEQKKYNEAIASYNQLINANVNAEQLFYNTAIAYFNVDSVAASIYYFEKAKMLNSNNKDIEHNLALAYGKQKDDIDKFPEFFLKAIFNSIINVFSSNTWFILGALILWLTFALFFFSAKIALKFKNRTYFLAAALGLLFLLFSYLNIANKAQNAIIFEKQLSIKQAPNFSANDMLQIHEGLKVKLLEQIDTWSKVELSDGTQGWLPTKYIKLL